MSIKDAKVILKLVNITKYYGKLVIFKDLNLTLSSNEYNYIIGENGCGKSTLLKCLCNLVNYQGTILGINKLKISYIPEKITLPDYIKVDNFLELLLKDQIKDKKEIKTYLEAFALWQHHDKYLYQLSLGTKQKILLIQGLMKEADAYFFDEPLNGLDIDNQKVFYDYLRKLKKKNKLIVIVTHRFKQYPFRNKRVIALEKYHD